MFYEKEEILHDLLKIITQYERLEKGIRNYGTETPIYFSEIHTISAIAENPGIHIGGLANHFGYTKGAISEIIRKLEKKGLVQKQSDPRNLSRLALYLTKKGETAHREHHRYHEMFHKMGVKIIKDMPREHIDLIHAFLCTLSERLSDFERND